MSSKTNIMFRCFVQIPNGQNISKNEKILRTKTSKFKGFFQDDEQSIMNLTKPAG